MAQTTTGQINQSSNQSTINVNKNRGIDGNFNQIKVNGGKPSTGNIKNQ